MSRKIVSVQRYNVRRKGMICNRPTDVCMRNLWQRRNGERKPVLILVPGSHERLASRKRIMCARNMGVHVQRGTQRTKGIKKRDEKSDSHAAEKVLKKLVSSNCTKILEKESSD
jgi:hypothetical protein